MKKGLVLLFFCFIFSFQSGYAQIIDFPDINFSRTLRNFNCVDTDGDGVFDSDADTNNDAQISVSEAEAVTNLKLSYSPNITSLEGIEYFTNLEYLDCRDNSLVNIDLTNNLSLAELYCDSFDFNGLRGLENVNISGLNLSTLVCIDSKVANFDLSTSTNLTRLEVYNSEPWINDRNLTTLDISACTNLTILKAYNNSLNELDLSNNTALRTVIIYENNLSELNLSNNTVLRSLNASSNNLSALGTSNNPNLITLTCAYNNLSSIDLINNINLKKLDLNVNELSNLGITTNSELEELTFLRNNITEIDLSQNPNLIVLNCGFNQISNLDLTQNNNLDNLNCEHNQIADLDLSLNNLLTRLVCNDNLIESLDLSQLPELDYFNGTGCPITELDFSNNPILDRVFLGENDLINTLDFSNNPVLDRLSLQGLSALHYLNIRNGLRMVSPEQLSLWQTRNLHSVCVDDDESDFVGWRLEESGQYTSDEANRILSNFCTTGAFSIQGQNGYDGNLNCGDSEDTIIPNLKFRILGSAAGHYIADDTGDFNIRFVEGNYTIVPELENPSYFSVSPESVNLNFPDDPNPFLQDFCIRPLGLANDLEIYIIPIEQARPGFNSQYKLIYKNNGNTTLSGDIEFNYDDDYMDLISSDPIADEVSLGNLVWNYIDLAPFESREIDIVMNLNTPVDPEFPLNGGDVLSYSVQISPIDDDETSIDNSFTLNQSVVNSFDPNDKTCLEGDTITPEQVGDYLHYLIRFENTGTANASRVEIVDFIDRVKFDLNTFKVLSASHNYFTRLNRGSYKIEFVFENINLPFDDENNDGYVLFKIRTRSHLALGQTIENDANIYFDFNSPIITNNEIVTIQEPTASIDEYELDSFKIYPNPVSETLFISGVETLNSVRIYSIKGGLVMEELNVNASDMRLNVSELAQGMYFIKLKSQNGVKTFKFIKN